MPTNKITQQQKQKLLKAVSNAGQANIILGWLWLANALVWASLCFIFSLKTNNPILTDGSIFATLGSGFFVFATVLSVVMGSLHLTIGTYIKEQCGPKAKVLLLVGVIASAIFFLSILPIATTIFSIYGYWAYRTLGAVAKPRSKQGFSLLRFKKLAIIVGSVSAIALLMSIVGYARLNSSTTGTGGNSKETLKEFDASVGDGTNKILGYCASSLPIKQGCRYTSQADGYTATFPSDSSFYGTPSVVYTSKAVYANKQASGRLLSNFTGYSLDLLYFTTATQDAATIQQRLLAGVNDEAITGSCQYDPDTSGTTETVTQTTYGNLPAASVTITGSDFEKKPCTDYALALMRDKTAFILVGQKNTGNAVTQSSFQTFVNNFRLNN